MIARAFIIVVLLIVLPDISIYQHYFNRAGVSKVAKVLWWTQTAILLVSTILLACVRDFTPHPQTSLNVFLFIIGAYSIPKFLWVLSFSAGRLLKSRRGWKRNWGLAVGGALVFIPVLVTIYGSTYGFNKFEIRRVDYNSASLPKGFDGYRVVLFSDAHLGNYESGSRLLKSFVDSVNALKPDIVLFLGDLQNTQPEEIELHLEVLSKFQAPDGVFSVLGNHDYSKYMGGSREEKLAAEKKTKDLERKMGWKLLLNENTMIYHRGDSIALAGVEGNEEKDPETQDHGWALFEKAVQGIPEGMFTIMMMHNPNHWRETIIPNTNVQLSLSGHTHGGQIDIMGLTTSSFIFTENNGMYESEGKSIFVTAGLGALIPLRFGVTGEAVLLTLHKK